eukprot:gnl/MRDRNA2_/MRDRNA2_262291_c0_seq1.p1 gnl/MRDRNA2_/MRDRNA2_262291_c0~~gnl/MRDRNA2_/MRDRNA2_262291_c0_seq1.p1  ORF type:complete len:182 (+),score=23.88 gnl/MRDRNA2_/MRDRNA2_262291_c0_seq1:78-623(+)
MLLERQAIDFVDEALRAGMSKPVSSALLIFQEGLKVSPQTFLSLVLTNGFVGIISKLSKRTDEAGRSALETMYFMTLIGDGRRVDGRPISPDKYDSDSRDPNHLAGALIDSGLTETLLSEVRARAASDVKGAVMALEALENLTRIRVCRELISQQVVSSSVEISRNDLAQLSKVDTFTACF